MGGIDVETLTRALEAAFDSHRRDAPPGARTIKFDPMDGRAFAGRVAREYDRVRRVDAVMGGNPLLELREVAWRLHAEHGTRGVGETTVIGSERAYHDGLLAAINGLLAEGERHG